MPAHLVFFLGALSFLSGVAYASLGLSLLFSFIPAAVVFAALYAKNIDIRVAILAALLIVSGSTYYHWYDASHQAAPTPAPQSGFFVEIKDTIKASYSEVLAPDQAALLFGIIFGDNKGFPKSFAQDLEKSGLRFITAIDGLHMQIVIIILFSVCASLLPRRYALLLTLLFALFFIALTGFTASGVRAGLMAGIAMLAREMKRPQLSSNALAFAALVLTLFNPRVLLFDIGFQLSFLAVIAIIYFLPVLRYLLRLGSEPGFLGWRESLLITLSVQLATAPIIISQFGTFSLTSFVGSVAFVWLLPFIIVLGFLLAYSAFISLPLAHLLALVTAPLLGYGIFVIKICAGLAVLFNPPLGFIGVAIYYGILVGLGHWFYSKERGRAEAPKPALAPEFKIIGISD